MSDVIDISSAWAANAARADAQASAKRNFEPTFVLPAPVVVVAGAEVVEVVEAPVVKKGRAKAE